MPEQFYNAVKNCADKYVEASFGDRSFPDAAFVTEHGTPKAPDGKGSLQDGRHLPHHNKNVKSPTENSSVDVSHLRNALARVGQTKSKYENQAEYTKRATTHLQNHAKALLKSYQKSSIEYKEIESVCAEFNIPLDESIANIKIMKNGPDDKPYCMVQDGKTLMCHRTFKEAQDHMNRMMN